MAHQNPLSMDVTPTNDSPERSELSRVKILAFVPEPLLDTDEAAAVMKIHPKTLQKLARRGSIHGIHVGKLWRFRASHIQDLLPEFFRSIPKSCCMCHADASGTSPIWIQSLKHWVSHVIKTLKP